ncbi:MAG: hypothetical protein ACFE95_22405 [Candidatus Hodarchaeota archaeon]
MYSEYSVIYRKTPTLKKQKQVFKVNKTLTKQQEAIERTKEELDRLANRALLLLSFKNTPTQNLKYVLKALGITTLEEKQRILREIFRLIREGIVYVPRGLPELIEKGIDKHFDLSKIDLCLLRPYEHLIQEIQREISLIKT